MVIGPFAYEGEDRKNNQIFQAFRRRKMVVKDSYQVVKDVNPPYSLWKTVWKGLRPALWASGAAALLVFVGYFSEASNLITMGLPPLLAMMLAEAIRNAIKEYRRRK